MSGWYYKYVITAVNEHRVRNYLLYLQQKTKLINYESYNSSIQRLLKH